MSTKQVFQPIIHAMNGAAGRIVASSNRHQVRRQIARLSPHRLQDIGFERDWDGSVYRASDLD